MLSQDKDIREQIVKDCSSRCSGILQEALRWAADSTKSLLQVCFQCYSKGEVANQLYKDWLAPSHYFCENFISIVVLSNIFQWK